MSAGGGHRRGASEATIARGGRRRRARRLRWWTVVACALAWASAGGCLEPLVDDEVVASGLVLPADGNVPPLAVNARLFAQLDANDGVDGVIELHRGFSDGRPVRFWDFGAAPPAAAPLYVLARAVDGGGMFSNDGQGYDPVGGHPTIIDVIPGDQGYTPFWSIVLLPVTDAYDGERVTSFEAVDEARALGLVDEPITLDLAINCPVVRADAQLEAPDGTLESPTPAYYRGYTTAYYDFEAFPSEALDVPVGRVFRLRREGGEPLSEPVRGVDMTGDGDLRDSNDVFATGHARDGGSALAELVEVVVGADYRSIDTWGDDQRADAMSDADIDAIAPDATGPVSALAVYPQGRLLNLPLAPEEQP